MAWSGAIWIGGISCGIDFFLLQTAGKLAIIVYAICTALTRDEYSPRPIRERGRLLALQAPLGFEVRKDARQLSTG